MITDAEVKVVMPTKPWVLPHIQIQPSQQASMTTLHSSILAKMMTSANAVSSVLFEVAGAQGSNIVVNDDNNSTTVNIVARSENDGLNFMWEPKPADQAELAALGAQLRDAFMIYEESPKKVEKTDSASSANEEKIESTSEESASRASEEKPKRNLMFDQLNRQA